MFYLQELLTERKQGIATIWLLAAFGSRSEVYRIRRKEIQSVNVTAACSTLNSMAYEVPFALRLQSTLLLGIARLYSLQAGYFFQEVTSTHAALRMHLQSQKAGRTIRKGVTVGRETLMLEDDPSFHPDLFFTVPGLKLENTPLPEDLNVLSLMSPPPLPSPKKLLEPGTARRARSSIAREESIQLLDYPIQEHHTTHQHLGGDDYLPDAPFEFNAEGEMIETASMYSAGPFMSGASYSAFSGHSPVHKSLLGDIDYQLPAIEGDIKQEGPPARPAADAPQELLLQGLHWTAPLPAILGNLSYYEYGAPDECDCTIWLEDDGLDHSDDEDSPGQRPQKKRTHLPPIDENTSIRNRDMRDWKDAYAENMRVAIQSHIGQRGRMVDKENRIKSLFNLGGRPLDGELAIFSPLQLMENGARRREVMGPPPLPPQQQQQQKGTRESLKPDGGVARHAGSEIPPTPLRARLGSEVELNLARASPAGILDLALDQNAPWETRSDSLGGGSIGGFSLGSRGVSPAGSFRSLTQRSKVGQSIRRPGSRSSWRRGVELDGRESLEGGEGGIGDDPLGALDPDHDIDIDLPASDQDLGPIDADHDREAFVFHEYLRLQIAEKSGPERNDIDFDVLLPPETTRATLAANALYLVIRLASKGLVRCVQEETFGRIGVELVEGEGKEM